MAASLAAFASLPQVATAGTGWADSDGLAANPATLKARTYYANSPYGAVPVGSCLNSQGDFYASTADAGFAADCDSGGAVISGASVGMRKFVDTLPGLAFPHLGADGNPVTTIAKQYIPIAVADTTTYPNSDYYEIAVVEYQQKMHSDLANPTTLRGYVQIDPLATDTAGVSKSAGSLGVALTNPNGSAIMISRPDGNGGFVSRQAYGFDVAHYLGPVIVAQHDRPTRMKFYNALPVGRVDANGKRAGDLFLPVDETLPGAGYGPDGMMKYTQNRAEVHLHGGDNPWISDGTPQQWITPAGEANVANPLSVAGEVDAINAGNAGPVNVANYLRGVSAYNVPDMPEPGPGAVTYYFPNGGSARLMFYHDHTFGLTRLNVYAGEAAGYVLTDAAEGTLIGAGGALEGMGVGIPLVIQDRTFVPKNIAMQDAKWDIDNWGGESSLWFPHVYEINQDPTSSDATNPGGRWDWGPWFWPVFPSTYDMPSGDHGVMPVGVARDTYSWTSLIAPAGLLGPSDLGLSEVTTTPEAFADTPTVNGVAYPEMEVDPKAYRFRILNAGNDRMLNLNFFVAVTADSINPNDVPSHVSPVDGSTPLIPLVCDGSQPVGSNCSEVDMVRFVSPNAILSTTYACPASGMTESTTYFPVSFPCAGGPLGTGWGSADNRAGGVPNPANVGPHIYQIGNEGGFFGTAHDIPPTINNFEYNKRSVTVLNMQERGLLLGGAERADIVVDFSAYAGKTLILYNDAPAPAPAGDPRIDYYTGVGDQTAAGGAINTLPGYGPNTRTVMRVKVKGTVPAAAFDFAALNTQLGAAYRATQAKPIVPQLAYNDIFSGIATKDTYANIFTGAIYLGNYRPLTFKTTGPIDYTPAPGNPIVKSVNGVPSTTAQAKCTTAASCQTAVDLIKGAGLVHADEGQTINAFVENKTIQELFDPNWGRMNATLGIEQGFVSALVQTTIPLGYVDPATEFLQDGETQIWKITHNGVDSHPVHFHLVNLQVVNRVGWDGTVKPPYPADIGWKETIVMSPLEDILVAAKAKKPVAPFGLPHSYRALDTSQPLLDSSGNAVTAGFTQINAITGQPALIANKMVDYQNEYVWHCHILGHEENDFMRAVVFDAKDVVPDAPTGLAAGGAVGGGVLLSWVDPTPGAAPATLANPKNEIGFRVERAPVVNGVAGNFAALGTVTSYPQLDAGVLASRNVNALANATGFTDATAAVGDYDYRVYTVNAAGETVSATARHAGALLAPSAFAVTSDTSSTVTLGWTDNATNEASYQLTWAGFSPNAVAGSLALPINSQSATATGLAANTQYDFSVAAIGTGGAAATVGSVRGTTAPVALAVTNPGPGTATGSVVSLPISWANSNPNVGTLTGITVTGNVGGTPINQSLLANATGVTLGNLPLSANYSLTVTVNGVGGSAATTVSGVTAGFVFNAATGLTAQVVSQTQANVLNGLNYALSWTDASLGESGYKVEICHGTCTAGTQTSTNIATNNRWYTIPAINVVAPAPATPTGAYSARVNSVVASAQNSYYFRVSPVAGVAAGPASNISAVINLNNAPAAPSNVSAVSNAIGAMTVSWTDTSNANQATQVQYAPARTLNTLTISNAGRGYTAAPAVTITPALADAGRIAIPATAVATVNLVPGSPTYGRVTSVTITNPGSGYTVAPTVSLSGGGLPTTVAAITASVTGNPVYVTAPSTTDGISSSQTITGLVSGRGYLFRVSATGVTGSQGNSATATNNGRPVVIN